MLLHIQDGIASFEIIGGDRFQLFLSIGIIVKHDRCQNLDTDEDLMPPIED